MLLTLVQQHGNRLRFFPGRGTACKSESRTSVDAARPVVPGICSSIQGVMGGISAICRCYVAFIFAGEALHRLRSFTSLLMLQIRRALSKCHCSRRNMVLHAPVCTRCGHILCKECVETTYASEVSTECSSRPLRTRKQRKPCPVCSKELAAFMECSTFQVSIGLEMVPVAAPRHGL